MLKIDGTCQCESCGLVVDTKDCGRVVHSCKKIKRKRCTSSKLFKRRRQGVIPAEAVPLASEVAKHKEGLGDIVGRWIKRTTGIDDAWMEARLGRPCNCSSRREKLNYWGRKLKAMFPMS